MKLFAFFVYLFSKTFFSLAVDMLHIHWIMKFRVTKRTENQEIMKFRMLEMRKFSR